MADPTSRLGTKALRPTLKLATWLGFAGGFLLAYQTSSRPSRLSSQSSPSSELITSVVVPTVRLWGWKENAREIEMDKKELGQLAKEGKPLYGETDLPEYIQGVAHRNSMWSQVSPLFWNIPSLAFFLLLNLRLDVLTYCFVFLPSQLKFGVLPWFNLVKYVFIVLLSVPSLGSYETDFTLFFARLSHQHHGTDASKYKSEE